MLLTICVKSSGYERFVNGVLPYGKDESGALSESCKAFHISPRLTGRDWHNDAQIKL